MREKGLQGLGCRTEDRPCAEPREGPNVLEPRLYKMIMSLQFELAANLHRADKEPLAVWSGRTRPSFFPCRVINTQTEAAKGEVSVSPKFKVQPIAAVKSKQQELEQPLTACPGQKRMHTCMRGTA